MKKNPKPSPIQELRNEFQLKSARDDRNRRLAEVRQGLLEKNKQKGSLEASLPDLFFIQELYEASGWYPNTPQSYGAVTVEFYAKFYEGANVPLLQQGQNIEDTINYIITNPINPNVRFNSNSAVLKRQKELGVANGSIYKVFYTRLRQSIEQNKPLSDQIIIQSFMYALYYLFQPLSTMICGYLYSNKDMTPLQKNLDFLIRIIHIIKPEIPQLQRKKQLIPIQTDWISDTCWGLFLLTQRILLVKEENYFKMIGEFLSEIQKMEGTILLPGFNPKEIKVLPQQQPEFDLPKITNSHYITYLTALAQTRGVINICVETTQKEDELLIRTQEYLNQVPLDYQLGNNPQLLKEIMRIWWDIYGKQIVEANAERVSSLTNTEQIDVQLTYGVDNINQLFDVLVKDVVYPADTPQQRDFVKNIINLQYQVAIQFYTSDFNGSMLQQKEQLIRTQILKETDVFLFNGENLEKELTKQQLYFSNLQQNLTNNLWRNNMAQIWGKKEYFANNIKHLYYSNAKYNWILKPPLVMASLSVWNVMRQLYYQYINSLEQQKQPFYLEQQYTTNYITINNDGQMKIIPNYLMVLPLIRNIYFPENIINYYTQNILTKDKNQYPISILQGRWLMLVRKENIMEEGQMIQVDKIAALPLYKHMQLFRLALNTEQRGWGQIVSSAMTFNEAKTLLNLPPIICFGAIATNIEKTFSWEQQDDQFEQNRLLIQCVSTTAEQIRDASTPIGSFLVEQNQQSPNEAFIVNYNFMITSQQLYFNIDLHIFSKLLQKLYSDLEEGIEEDEEVVKTSVQTPVQFDIQIYRKFRTTTRVYSNLNEIQLDFATTDTPYGTTILTDMALPIGIQEQFYEDDLQFETDFKYLQMNYDQIVSSNLDINQQQIEQFEEKGIKNKVNNQWWAPKANMAYKYDTIQSFLVGSGAFLRDVIDGSGNLRDQEENTIHNMRIEVPKINTTLGVTQQYQLLWVDQNGINLTPTIFKMAAMEITNRQLLGVLCVLLWESVATQQEKNNLAIQRTINCLAMGDWVVAPLFSATNQYKGPQDIRSVYILHLDWVQYEQANEKFQYFLQFITGSPSMKEGNLLIYPLPFEKKLNIIRSFYSFFAEKYEMMRINLKTTMKDVYQTAQVCDYEVMCFMRKINDVQLQSIRCLSQPEMIGIISTFQYHSFPYPPKQNNKLPTLDEIITAILDLENQFSCLQIAFHLFWSWRELIAKKQLYTCLYRSLSERNQVFQIFSENIKNIPQQLQLQSISQLLQIIQESDFAKYCSVKLLDPNRYDRCLKVLHQQTDFIPNAPGVHHNFYIILNHVFYSQYEIKCIDIYQEEKIQLYNNLGYVMISGSSVKYQQQTTSMGDQLYIQAGKSYDQMQNYYYDIECYQVENEKKELEQIPFLLCVIKGENKTHFSGESCVEQFLDYVYYQVIESLKQANWSRDNAQFNFFGFNSSKFDAIFVLNHMIQTRGMNFTLTGEITSPKSIKLTFPRISNGKTSDNGNLLWFNATISFLDVKLVSKKGGLAEQAKVFLPDQPQFQKSKISPYGKGVIFSKQQFINDEQYIVDYCYQDCLALREIHKELLKQLYVQLNKIQLARKQNVENKVAFGLMNMLCSQTTLASLCYKTYKMIFLQHTGITQINGQYSKLAAEIYETNKKQQRANSTYFFGTWDKQILKAEQNAYHGGYCVVHKMNFQQIGNNYMTYWDFNSLYPTAMIKNIYYNKKSTFPYRIGKKSHHVIDEELSPNDIYRIYKFRAGEQCKLGFIAIKQKKIAQLIYPLSFKCINNEELWLWGQEIIFLRKEYNYQITLFDCEFNSVHYSEEFELDMFDEYVNCFNQMKEEGDKEKNQIKRTFAKDFMNSLYGIFGFKKNEQSLICKDDCIMSFQDDVNPYSVDLKQIKTISKHKNIKTIKIKPEHKTDVGTLVRFASKITSTARITLWWHMKILENRLPNYQFYACDTDSIMCSCDQKPEETEQLLLNLKIAHDKNSQQSQLGKLKMEYGKDPIIIEGVFIMKKTYKLRFENKKKAKSVYKIKGIKQEQDPRKEYGQFYKRMEDVSETDSSDDEKLEDNIREWAAARANKYKRLSYELPFSKLNEISFVQQLQDYYISKFQLHKIFRTFQKFKGNWSINLEQFQQWKRSVDGVIIVGAGDKNIKQTLTYQKIVGDLVNNIEHESYIQ